ncbi:MAG: DUF6265 family protein [Saprospiraceae bacterium]
MKKFSLYFICLFFIASSCRQDMASSNTETKSPNEVGSAKTSLNTASELLWLQGTWESEDKSSIETWAVQGDSLSGNVYSASAKKIIEVLSIKKVNDFWVYSAKVLDQNQGKTIPFRLLEYSPDHVIFSNPNHDFPNKVSYTKIDSATMHIKVSDNFNKSFEYKVRRLD